MLKALFFSRAYYQRQFAQALAYCGSFPRLDNAYQFYACHRLDMHRTLAGTEVYTGKNWRGGVARAVALLACGRSAEAEQQTALWLERDRSSEQRIAMAKGLAPFHPGLALSLLDNVSGALLLRSGLCLRMGRMQQAREFLVGCSVAEREACGAEFDLFLGNVSSQMSPQERLAGLNRFLSASGLETLSLLDSEAPPSQLNVISAVALPAVRGPLVTVLMTTFNSAQRVTRAIQSILDQTYRDIELIVVDDDSSDETGQIVQALAAKDPRILYIGLARNVGTYVAKNIGMRFAKGEFAICHDSDDWSHPQKIERQVAPLLADSQLVFTISQWVRLQDDGIYYARPVYPLLRHNPASPLFRRKLVLEKAGAWDPVRTGVDSEFLARLKLVFGRKAMKRIVQPLTLGSHRPDSLMTASDTGYSAEGMSPTRLDYWESWNRWHIDELRAGRKPKLQSFEKGRNQFDAPVNIVVPQEDIDYCVKHAQVW